MAFAHLVAYESCYSSTVPAILSFLFVEEVFEVEQKPRRSMKYGRIEELAAELRKKPRMVLWVP